jgi:hypothetical protein
MKKPTRSTPYDEPPDPMRDLDIELDSQDDEIIDLEDIIEMPDRPIDEDEDLDLDVEILDVDSDFEPQAQQPPKFSQRSIKEQAPRSEEKDLIGEFGDESEDVESLFDELDSAEPPKKTASRAEPKVFDEDESSLIDELMNETGVPDSGKGEARPADLRERAAAAIKIPEEARSVEIEPEPAAAGSLEPELMPVPPPADFSKTAEELIGRIESSLQEHIRVMVESRLPDLVRSIISEEIEKLKKEPH